MQLVRRDECSLITVEHVVGNSSSTTAESHFCIMPLPRMISLDRSKREFLTRPNLVMAAYVIRSVHRQSKYCDPTKSFYGLNCMRRLQNCRALQQKLLLKPGIDTCLLTRMSRPPSFSMVSLMARFRSSSLVRSATMETPCFSCDACDKTETRTIASNAAFCTFLMHFCRAVILARKASRVFQRLEREWELVKQRAGMLTTASKRSRRRPKTATVDPLASKAKAAAFPMPADPPAKRKRANCLI